MKKLLATFLAVFLFHNTTASAAISEWKENETSGAKTRLIASFYQDENGTKKLIAGLEFKLPSGWKIYGPDSAGIGVPPMLELKESTNYASHQIIWPAAEAHEEKIGDETFKYSAYHNDIVLPITVDLDKTSDTTQIVAKLDYGLCKDVCIPVSESFNVTVTNEEDDKALGLIQKFYPQKISKNSDVTSPALAQKSSPSLIKWIIIAIIGGAILNIMPCVLPVLSFKLLSVIDHLDAKISRIRFAFFATSLGIISCFVVFGIFAYVIKLAGNSFGWGLQFQNPFYLIFLILILIFFIANLMGIFEITFDQFAATFLNKKINDSESKKNIFIPNFLSGVLAVLLATPCSAPILGSAISFALTQEMSDIFLIFIAIGAGFALPYIILMITPKLVFLLPKPGNWMMQVKKLMALFLAVTVAWLSYVLLHNIGVIPTIAVVIFMLLLPLCLEIKSKFIKFFTIITIISATFVIPTIGEPMEKEPEISKTGWMRFDEMILRSLVAQGKIVVIDVTADWCITCKVNKLTVFNDKEVIEKLSDDNIVTMRADITKPNPEVMEFLKKHNRFAIPFNAVYGPEAKNGMLTSELLTKKQLFELIDKAK